MDGETHILHGPAQDWLTVDEANRWCQLPEGYLDRLAKLGLIAQPQDLGHRSKKYHWQYVVALKWSISLGYVRLPPPKRKPDDPPDDDE